MDKVTEAEIAAIIPGGEYLQDEYRKAMDHLRAVVPERDQLKAELATAKAAIRAAPHHQDCAIKYNAPCNCWKSKAKAELVTAKAEIERLEGERLKNWSIELIEGGTTLAVMHLPSRSVIMVTENNDRIAADILWMLGTDLLKALQGEPNG